MPINPPSRIPLPEVDTVPYTPDVLTSYLVERICTKNEVNIEEMKKDQCSTEDIKSETPLPMKIPRKKYSQGKLFPNLIPVTNINNALIQPLRNTSNPIKIPIKLFINIKSLFHFKRKISTDFLHHPLHQFTRT